MICDTECALPLRDGWTLFMFISTPNERDVCLSETILVGDSITLETT